MIASISKLISVEVEDSYPWKDTLFINSGVATFDKEDIKKCSASISIQRCTETSVDDCRDIGEGLFIGENVFVDNNFGVRLERKDKKHITMKVTQECNEWLVICIQLLLLELNCTLIHAAALEKNSEVVLLPSWGGVGKTATVLRMVKEDGWRLLGDDLVILKENEILPFLKPFVIYPYHKSLFPEIFEEKKGRVITNLKINSLMSKTIPTVKKVMRPIPGLLAFARKHNPQSMRVSPMKIFNENELSDGGKIERVVWLERIIGENVTNNKATIDLIASKTVSVSMMELFADRMNCIFALCGAGILDYKQTQVKMYNLIVLAYENTSCYELDIPTSVPIEKVGNVVLKNISTIKNGEKVS